MFNQTLWEKVVEFHGHQCPGLAMGFRAALAGIEYLGVDRAGDEELVAVAETDACGIDAIQVLAGCSLGKGNLIFKNYGKQAFTFIDRKKNRAVRVYVDASKLPVDKNDRAERIKVILSAPQADFCEIKEVKVEIPEKAQIFQSLTCSQCGERMSEARARLQDGKPVCLGCTNDYTRGW